MGGIAANDHPLAAIEAPATLTGNRTAASLIRLIVSACFLVSDRQPTFTGRHLGQQSLALLGRTQLLYQPGGVYL